jgi:hypothetical protein
VYRIIYARRKPLEVSRSRHPVERCRPSSRFVVRLSRSTVHPVVEINCVGQQAIRRTHLESLRICPSRKPARTGWIVGTSPLPRGRSLFKQSNALQHSGPESPISGQGENWNRNDGELKVSCEAQDVRTALKNASPRVEWLRMGRLALHSSHLQGYKHSPLARSDAEPDTHSRPCLQSFGHTSRGLSSPWLSFYRIFVSGPPVSHENAQRSTRPIR